MTNADVDTYRIGLLTPATAYHVKVTQLGGSAADASLSTATPVSTNAWSVSAKATDNDDEAIHV